ncbi:MAG: hypothetical protein GXO87_14755 [Chlorobi bacterium]|nr:hypothetical protein [Chlorobiota bacterium]
MKRTYLLWIAAVIITLATAYYQRVTGPTYPIKGKFQIEGKEYNYKFVRSHGGEGSAVVELPAPENVSANLFWKRFKTEDAWTKIPMKFSAGKLTANLPHQPPAGKLEYYIELYRDNEKFILPEKNSVVIRFKGTTPLFILIPHVFAMFSAMLLSTRTGLEFFNPNRNLKKLTYWTLAVLFVGGFILGPIMQKYAFGEFWTGIPFGIDLTDNKTLFAFAGWLIALFMYDKSKNPKAWAAFGAVLLMIMYMIPHSALGSEIDYNKLDNLRQTENQIGNSER